MAIADQHEYLVRYRFQHLMNRHQLTNADLDIDHQREELDITVGSPMNCEADLSYLVH